MQLYLLQLKRIVIIKTLLVENVLCFEDPAQLGSAYYLKHQMLHLLSFV